MLNYAKICGKCKIVRKCAENCKLCDSALTALKSCLCRFVVARRPLGVGGEMEEVVLLKGDLDLLGYDVLIDRTGMRDGHGGEVVTAGEAG